MPRRRNPIVFVLGPSGSGKSTLGRGLAALGFDHLEIDRWTEGDGIDLAGIRAEWDTFLKTAWIAPLVAALDARAARRCSQGIVVTFPGGVVFSAPHLAAVDRCGVRLIVLHASAAECLAGYVARERAQGRAPDSGHWIANNAGPHAHFGAPLQAPYRLTSHRDGAFIGAEVLVAQALARIGGEPADAPEVADSVPELVRASRLGTR